MFFFCYRELEDTTDLMKTVEDEKLTLYQTTTELEKHLEVSYKYCNSSDEIHKIAHTI